MDDDARLDNQMIAELREVAETAGGRRRIDELLAIFLTSTSDRLDGLRRAVERGDREETRRLAHSIRGSSVSFGARRLGELAAGVERASTDGQPVAASAVEELQREFDGTAVALADALTR